MNEDWGLDEMLVVMESDFDQQVYDEALLTHPEFDALAEQRLGLFFAREVN